MTEMKPASILVGYNSLKMHRSKMQTILNLLIISNETMVFAFSNNVCKREVVGVQYIEFKLLG